jgi:hypothetical protein
MFRLNSGQEGLNRNMAQVEVKIDQVHAVSLEDEVTIVEQVLKNLNAENRITRYLSINVTIDTVVESDSLNDKVWQCLPGSRVPDSSR